MVMRCCNILGSEIPSGIKVSFGNMITEILLDYAVIKVTPNLRGCLPEKNSYARCFLGNHHNLYIDKKLI